MNGAVLLDLFLLVCLVAAAVRGWVTGAMRPLVGLLAIGVGGAAAWGLYEPVAAVLPAAMSDLGRKAVACIAMFLIAAGGMTWLLGRLTKEFEKSPMQNTNRLAGAGLAVLRLCLAASFVIRVLHFHPTLLPSFQKSFLTPVVLYTGFAVRAVVPSAFAEPPAAAAREVMRYRGLEISVTSKWTGSDSVRRTIRATGSDRLPFLTERGRLFASEEGWSVARRPAGTGLLTLEAEREASRLEDLAWALSSGRWSSTAGAFASTFDLDEEFQLAGYAPQSQDVFLPASKEGEGAMDSLRRELAALEAEVTGRVADQLAESIEVPLHVRCELPHEVLRASPAGVVNGKTIVWDLRLRFANPVRVSAHAEGRGWGSRLPWVGGALAAMGAGWFVVRRRLDAARVGVIDSDAPPDDASSSPQLPDMP